MSRREISIDEQGENATNGGRKEEEMKAQNMTEGSETISADERIATLEQENAQLRDQLLRSVADMDNYRRRMMQEREQTVQFANERLLRDLLPVIDDFQRSVDAGGKTRDFDNFYRGVEMIDAKLRKMLEQLGVQRIETVGEPFNVDLHEAILRQPSDAPEDTVITEVEPGYTYNGRVLRHAKVIVSAGS